MVARAVAIVSARTAKSIIEADATERVMAETSSVMTGVWSGRKLKAARASISLLVKAGVGFTPSASGNLLASSCLAGPEDLMAAEIFLATLLRYFLPVLEARGATRSATHEMGLKPRSPKSLSRPGKRSAVRI